MDISTLTDAELLKRTERLAARRRISDADLIEHLAEIDRRHATERNFGSLFDYCVHRLKMSDGAALRRIRAARMFRTLPPVGEFLRDGRLTLEALALLHKHREAPDIASLVLKAAGLTTRQLEALLAERGEPGPARDCIHYVRAPEAPVASSPDEGQPLLAASTETPHDPGPREVAPVQAIQAIIAPTSQPKRALRFAFTADEDFFKMLSQARAMLRHKYPDGRLEGVLRDALKALLARDPWRRPRASGRRPARS